MLIDEYAGDVRRESANESELKVHADGSEYAWCQGAQAHRVHVDGDRHVYAHAYAQAIRVSVHDNGVQSDVAKFQMPSILPQSTRAS